MNNVIRIFGDKNVGKTSIAIMLGKILAKENNNVLLIDFNKNKDIFNIFNIKNKDKLVKINNIYISNKIIKKNLKKFNFIIMDNPNKNYLKEFNNCINIFLGECNLLGIKKLIRLIKNTKEIKKENIKIIFNKYNKYSIDIDIIYKILNKYKIIGKINFNNKMEELFNQKYNVRIKKIEKNLLKIIKNI